MYDTVIVGGGAAGLNAALVLGRVRRRVLLVDAGRPRNAIAHEVHGFLTRDGTAPAELNRIGRVQLSAYPSVEVVDGTVESVAAGEDGFDVELTGGRREQGRRLLLATGVVDELPPVPGPGRVVGHRRAVLPVLPWLGGPRHPARGARAGRPGGAARHLPHPAHR